MTSRFNLDPLHFAGYRRYLLATMLASLSLWIYQPALEWMVLRQTGATAAVGFIQSALIVPVALAALPSGLLVDRIGARRTLAISLSGICAVMAIVGVLAAAGALTFELAVLLTVALGAFDGLYGVPVMLMLNHLVEPRHLGSAIGLSMLTTGLGRLIGAPIGGAVLEAFGPGQAMLPAAAGLGLTVLVVLTIALRPGEERSSAGMGLGELRDSVRWLWREPTALAVTLLAAIAAIFALGYGALLPTVTRDLLHADSGTLGILSGSAGIGIIASALTMEWTGRRVGRGRVVVGALLATALSLAGLGLAGVLAISVTLSILIAGFSFLFGGTAQFLLMTIAPPRMRGRALALYGFVIYALLPISTVAVGLLADQFGVRIVLIGMGALTILGTAAITLANRILLGIDIADGRLTVHGVPLARTRPGGDRPEERQDPV